MDLSEVFGVETLLDFGLYGSELFEQGSDLGFVLSFEM